MLGNVFDFDFDFIPFSQVQFRVTAELDEDEFEKVTGMKKTLLDQPVPQ
jgi:hypothetical protein